MASISDMFPWISYLPECRKIQYNIQINIFKITREVNIPKQITKHYKNSIDLITALQENLLFPFSSEPPFICNASTLVLDRGQNILHVCVPLYPLYYGYKMFIQIHDNGSYEAVLNPDIEKLFANNFEILQIINFTYLPYEICDTNLLDHENNVAIKNWLLACSADIICLSKDIITHINAQSMHFDWIENNKLIIEFLQQKYEIDQQMRQDDLLSTLNNALAKVTNFATLQQVWKSENTKILYDVNDLELRHTMYLTLTLEKNCTSFIEEAHTQVKDNWNDNNGGEIECVILTCCEEKTRESLSTISEKEKHIQPFIMTVIKNIFHNTALYMVYDQMLTSYYGAEKSRQFIFPNLDNSVHKSYIHLHQFIKKRNSHKLQYLPSIILDHQTLYDSVTNDSVDISSYTLKQLYDFVKFHENTIDAYPEMESDNIPVSLVNRSSKEFLYFVQIQHMRGTNIGKKVLRHNVLIVDHIKKLEDIFNVNHTDIKIQDIFRKTPVILPETFWDVTKGILTFLNEIIDLISFFTGTGNVIHFDVTFPNSRQKSNFKLISSNEDLDIYIKEIKSFKISHPSNLTNYVFSVVPKDIKMNFQDENELKYIKQYAKEWKTLVKEYEKAESLLLKAQHDFTDTTQYLLSLDTLDVSALFKEICKKTDDNWFNILPFLTSKCDRNDHRNIFSVLKTLAVEHKDILFTALKTCTVLSTQEDRTSEELFMERLQLIRCVVNRAFHALSHILRNILDEIDKVMYVEERRWHDAHNRRGIVWQEDFVFYTKDEPKVKGKTLPFKEIVNSDLISCLDLMKKVTTREVLNKHLADMFNKYKPAQWLFSHIDRSGETCAASKLEQLSQTHFLGNNDFEKEINQDLNLSLENEKRLLLIFSHYLALFIIEIFDQFKPYNLLELISQDKLKDEMRTFDTLAHFQNILCKYPCYGLVKIIDNVNYDTNSLIGQISVYQQISLIDGDGHSLDIVKKISTKPCSPMCEVQTSHFLFDIIKDISISKRPSLSLRTLKTILSERYWQQEFLSDLNTIQQRWSKTGKAFCLCRIKKTKNSSAHLTINGVKHHNWLNFFCENVTTNGKFSSLVTNVLENENDSGDEENKQRSIADWITKNVFLKDHSTLTEKSPFSNNTNLNNSLEELMKKIEYMCLSDQNKKTNDENMISSLNIQASSNVACNDDISDVTKPADNNLAMVHSSQDNWSYEELEVNSSLVDFDLTENNSSHKKSLYEELKESSCLHYENLNAKDKYITQTLLFNTNNFYGHRKLVQEQLLFQKHFQDILFQYNQKEG